METDSHAMEASCTRAPESDAPSDNSSVQRVRLRTIVIDNFKNYVGQHELDLNGEAFVCFFGRNGAGKSCVVDAIAFCLGATPQQLRVKRLANLVNDIVVTSNPEASAEVTLWFEHVDADGKKTTLAVKRAIEAATSQSRYFCRETEAANWKSTSKGVLEARLHALGIDMQLQDRFIIRQANATGLAQMTALQLLHFCERIIGTCDLKEKLALLNREWSERSIAAEQLREKIFAKENEATQCQPMVSKFQGWVEKTEKIREAHHGLKVSLINVDQQILRHHQIEMEQVKAEVNRQRNEASMIRVEIEDKEKERATLVDHVEEHQKNVLVAVQQLKRNTREKAKCSSKLQNATEGRKSVLTRLENFKREKAESTASLVEVKAQGIADSSLLAEKQQQLQAINGEILNHQTHTEAQENRDHDIHELAQEIERIEAAQREAMSNQATLTRERSEHDKVVLGMEKELNTHLHVKAEKEKLLKDLERRLTADHQAAIEVKKALVTQNSQLQTLESDIGLQLRQKAKYASRSEGDRAICQLQESLGCHVVLGRLGELASTEAKYARAVSSALHAKLSFVVVQDRQAAVRISRVFADKEIGRVTCCVLEDYGDSEHSSLPDDGFGYGVHDCGEFPIPLCRVLTCSSEKARQIFHRFGHNWMICQDADQAVKLSRGGVKNYVTLQGDVFFSDGSIRACRHENKQTAPNRPSIRVTNAPSAPCKSKSVDSIDTAISSLSDQIRACRAHQVQAQARMDEVNKRIHSNSIEVEMLKAELRDTYTIVDALETRLLQARHKLRCFEPLASQSFLDESKACKTKLAELKKRKSRLSRSGDKKDKERSEMLANRARLIKETEVITTREASNEIKATRLQAKERVIKEQIAVLEETLDELTNEGVILQRQVDAVQEDMDAAIKKVEDEKASHAQQNCALEQHDALIRSLTVQRREVRSSIERLIKKEDAMATLISSLESEIKEIELSPSEVDQPMEHSPLDQLEEQRSKLRQDMKIQEEEQRVMELVKASISVETVERAIACEQQLQSFQVELDSALADLTTLSARQHEVAMTRHRRLVDALQVVNDNLSRVYRLMNEDGDCYLGYSQERTTLFSEGITLNCKPDESHWQPFVGLSGGQQVVCAVSLMLALQSSFPSSFYVCDEIDAALDTVNVRKLAELLRDQSHKSSTQFLVVSHRPEMWETAKYLIGVYERDKSAQTISCRFE